MDTNATGGDDVIEDIHSKPWVEQVVRVQGDLIHILHADGSFFTALTRAEWLQAAGEMHERRMSMAQRARPEIPLEIQAVVIELKARAAEAEALRSALGAGKIMWGQAQAYRDAIALLEAGFKR